MQVKENPPQIRVADIPTVVRLSRQIPELVDPYPAAEYERRLEGVPHLILAAYTATDEAVGFKVAYERDGFFYSWMGGVHPDYRRRGLARRLAEAQEAWARGRGYSTLTFKPRNRLKAMLCFALQRGFDIVRVAPQPDPAESRIWLRKTLGGEAQRTTFDQV